MTNRDALIGLCNAIANTFYPDSAAINIAFLNEEIDPDGTATPKDGKILRMAVALVMGYVESSRSENGVSTSVKADAVEDSIRYWCGIYGIDANEVLNDYLRVIEDCSNLW